MKPQSTLSPISLRYIAALRGHKPKKTGSEFTYAEMGCSSPDALICLAASNPEGRFYGFMPNDVARRTADDKAMQRGTFNVIFLTGTPSEVLTRIAGGSSLPPMLDYLCCDETESNFSATERAALFDLAQKRLNQGGILATKYRAYDKADGALRFVINEVTPEMNDQQKIEFLSEIKKLGTKHLSTDIALSDELDKAIADKAPQSFFAKYMGDKSTSHSFDTMVAMGSRGFSYAGDANMTLNYVEMVVPAAAQDLVVECRSNPLYEQIKDLAIDRTIRTDLWIKEPSERSSSPVELFGGFAYGLVTTREQIPASHPAQGKNIDLSEPSYSKIIELLSMLPVGIADILEHPSCEGISPEKAMEVLQILVACGYAIPMRGSLTTTKMTSVEQPKLVGSFNRFLDKTELGDNDVLFASQVAGCGIALSAREAFVIQAINRVGLNGSVSALMPELRRIANTPTAEKIIQEKEPTPEGAHAMIIDIAGKSLPQWYAYALLEAA